jgi:hypothetical protein
MSKGNWETDGHRSLSMAENLGPPPAAIAIATARRSGAREGRAVKEKRDQGQNAIV